ncbi:rSAM-modified peptide [Flavobacterium sp. ANB]|nr:MULTISPECIES: rSAM-modified peptide [unclassified Flavobacterium]MBF4515061.1 rSAM-modified peptide [Flavobacterium sp. ANB]MTD69973.1 rSAM-modified peptide [Flavobacterium sp. LC2016-13]
MTNTTLTLGDFAVEKLTKKQQKTVRGGDAPEDDKDPNKGGTGGNGGTT